MFTDIVPCFYRRSSWFTVVCTFVPFVSLVFVVYLASITSAYSATGPAKESDAQADNAPALSARKHMAVEVSGIEGDLKDNVLLHLGLYDSVRSKKSISERSARRLYKSSIEEAKLALQAYGYYRPTIRKELTGDEDWLVKLDITPGPVTRFRKVSIALSSAGNEVPQLRSIVEESAVREGEVLLHEAYSGLKSGLRKTAYDLGYLDAEFTEQSLHVFSGKEAADVVLAFDIGERYFFGPITIEQDTLNPDFVDKFVTLQEGDPFEGSRLVELQLTLSEANYFNNVGVDIDRENAVDRYIPVNLQASPRKAAKYSFSLGYGTDTGPRFGVGTDVRRVNRRGHRFSSELQVSEVHSSLAARYSIPIGDVRSESVDFTAHIEEEDINSVTSNEYRVGGSLNQNRWGGVRRLSLEVAHEDWRFGEGPKQNATLIIPGLNFTFKNADDPFFSRRGYSYTLQLRGGAQELASDVTFGQAVIFGRGVLPLTERGRILARVEYGVTVTDDFEDLPPSLRFFAGGAQSVRGYGYKDLSPRDAQGNLIGGKYFTAGSLEADYLIRDNMGVAVFVDAGDATRDPIDQLKVGAGLGFRYRSPVGMFRLDLAHPFDDPDESYRIHISFGADL